MQETKFDCLWIDQRGCCRQCENCEWYSPVDDDIEESEYEQWLEERKIEYEKVVSDFNGEAGL